MDSFTSALVYTPGDNEWTDCHRLLAGAYDPLDRLHFIRTHYFRTAESLGRQPIRLERQADVMPGFESIRGEQPVPPLGRRVVCDRARGRLQ